ncbi:MAG: hypothetical protein JSR72_23790 [Proteobacteria bacterium]|nr:hypothetical protein [Pseudomonadota bacterium]
MNTETMSLGEFVKQLAVRMTKAKIAMPFKDERPWHVVLYDLATSDLKPKPEFLKKLQFDWDGPYPRSRDLSDYIHGLHFTGCVSAANPSYGEITLDGNLAKMWSALEVNEDVKKFMDKAMLVAEKKFNG